MNSLFRAVGTSDRFSFPPHTENIVSRVGIPRTQRLSKPWGPGPFKPRPLRSPVPGQEEEALQSPGCLETWVLAFWVLFEKSSFHFVSAQTFTFILEFVVGLNGGGGPAGKAGAAYTPTI